MWAMKELENSIRRRTIVNRKGCSAAKKDDRGTTRYYVKRQQHFILCSVPLGFVYSYT
jgi:hypothetical protein